MEKNSLQRKVAQEYGEQTFYATHMWSRGEMPETLRHLGVFFHRKTGVSFLFLEGEEMLLYIADGGHNEMLQMGQAFQIFARLNEVDLYGSIHGLGALDEPDDELMVPGKVKILGEDGIWVLKDEEQY